MVDDTLYVLENVKKILGETGDSNNSKITMYGIMADNKVKNSLNRVRDPDTGNLVLPFTTDIPNEIHDLADELTVGYFYKYESGSVDILEQALLDLEEYIDTHYRRPRFTAEGGGY